MVQFENETIGLEILEDGICLENGWTITPLVLPVVSLLSHYYWLSSLSLKLLHLLNRSISSK